jgi:phage terminase large subunit
VTRIRTNIVYDHLLQSNKKIVIEQGGTRSGKTYNILLWIIFDYCTSNQGKTITICRKTFPALRATVMSDFLDILRTNQIYREEFHNKSNSEYYLFGNLIEFISLDQPQKVRGRKRDLLYSNEINELTWEDWQQLIFRTNERIIGDFNPSDEYHWLYDKVISRDDCDFYQTTYLDNPFLDKTLIDEIERLKDTDEQYWQIYGLGLRARSKSTIFNYIEIDKIPYDAEFVSYGMDYGFTNDPTTLVATYKKDHNLYFEELLYRTGMTTGDIHQFLKSKNVDGPIYADTAEPRLNEELRRMGWNIRKSEKDIRAGIDMLKRHKIHITKDSTNAIMEFRNYKWKEDKSGIITNMPIDLHNHIVDACRYSTYSILSKPNFGKYAIR